MAKTPPYLSAHSPESIHEARALFGERLRVQINSLAMTQSDLARKAGLQRDAISNYVRGLAWPTPLNLRKLSKALGMKPDDLIPSMSEVSQTPQKANENFELLSTDDGYLLRFSKRLSFDQVKKIMAIIEN